MFKRNFFNRHISFFLLLPLILWLVCFAIVPLGYGFWLSFHDARIVNLNDPTWIGLENYIDLFKAGSFRNALQWSFVFSVLSVSVEMVVGMATAQLFTREFPGKGIAITLFLLPMIVSPALMGTMFRLLFNEFVGPIAYLLSGVIGTTALLGV
ncbi:MAG TPA: sugar ABC transporter permease, partial [Anaerolineaceae bacterium]|nr:sugar ABC transporter permease [Anaerolineaceae bacterium]